MEISVSRIFSKQFFVIWIGLAAVVVLEVGVLSVRKSEPGRWEGTPTLQFSIPQSSSTVTIDRGAGGSMTLDYRFHDQTDRLEGAVEDQLAFSEGLCGVFAPEGMLTSATPLMEIFYFEYEAGNPRFIHDVYGHAPEVCMRATGALLQGTHPDRQIEVDGRSMPVRIIEFKTPKTQDPLWMFKLTWVPDGAPYQPDKIESSLRKEKIQAGLQASPRPPARVILAGSRNVADLEIAWRSFEDLVGKNLKIADS